jgi:glucosylceramidase
MPWKEEAYFFISGYKIQPVTMNRFLFLIILTNVLLPNLLGQQIRSNKADVYISVNSEKQFIQKKEPIAFENLNQPEENYPAIIIDTSKTFQSIIGFGGAFTDAVAENYALLSDELKRQFLVSCFDSVNGNGYTLCRTSINSNDFSSSSYTYDDVPDDVLLTHFSIDHEKNYRIPLILDAQQIANNRIKLFASPWSPPAWMKTNNSMLHGGKLKPEYYQVWANYFVKYLHAMKNENVPIWGITVQNEPMAAQIFESCVYTAEDEFIFVKKYLGPALSNAGLYDVKLMIWDHNRGLMYQRVKKVYDDPEASKYVWGTAFHCYVGDHFDNVRLVHEAYPDKYLIFTEAGFPGDKVTLDNIDAAENLAKSVINDLNNWANGWVIWNMLLNEDGKPSHVGFHGLPPIIYNTKSNELIYHNTYYYFGHFSRFIKPEAKRVICSSNDDEILATAFLNKNGRTAVVVLNLTGNEKPYQIWIDGKAAKTKIPAHSIMTVIL